MSLSYAWRKRVLDLAGSVAKLPDQFPKQKGAVYSSWAAALRAVLADRKVRTSEEIEDGV